MVNVLLLGGHGKVAQHVTRILTSKSHHVTSIIRNPDQIPQIQTLGPSNLITPKVFSIEEATDDSIPPLLNGIDWVIWSAGAGGKGGAQRTKRIDHDACCQFISAALKAPSVKKFLLVSANCARRSPASWYNDEDKKTFKQAWDAIGVYCEAKTAADEFLWNESRKIGDKKEGGWEDIDLRPGELLDEPGTGKVDLGRAKATGGVPREDVARVAVELLEKGGAGGLWVDLVKGEEEISEAVERVVSQKVTSKEE